MASRYRIEMNYRQALLQAARLEELADRELSIARGKYLQTIENISSGWTGENADAYRQKAEQLKEKMEKSGRRLKNAAAAVRRIAENTYRAEMRALELANRRSYGGSR